MFGSEREVIAIDCETHALVPPRPMTPWREGRFGLMTMLDPEGLSTLRLVQVGWAKGDIASAEPEVKTRMVKPEGFHINDQATAKHRISHALAEASGVTIRTALVGLCTDIFEVCERGGRVAGHHLEFDATLIAQELQLLGLREMLTEWEACVRKGFCSMSPHIGQWIRRQAAQAIPDAPQRIPIKLSDAVFAMLPGGTKLLEEHHDAGRDALMRWLLYQELARRVAL